MVILCVKYTKRSEVNICTLFRAFNLFCATGCIFVNSYCMCAHHYHLMCADYLIHKYRQVLTSGIDIRHKDVNFISIKFERIIVIFYRCILSSSILKRTSDAQNFTMQLRRNRVLCIFTKPALVILLIVQCLLSLVVRITYL